MKCFPVPFFVRSDAHPNIGQEQLKFSYSANQYNIPPYRINYGIIIHPTTVYAVMTTLD
jgi:hypothetical protein